MNTELSAFHWRGAIPAPSIATAARRNARQVAALLARVIELDRTGMRPVQIAAHMGITRRYVQQLRKRAGLAPGKRGKGIKPS